MKMILKAGIAAATLMMFAAPAAAQVQFTGTTAGCFGAACAPVTGTTTFSGLSYTSGSFSQATDNTGFLALGGLTDNFGSFALAANPQTYTGQVFRLLVSFTAPTAVAGANTFESLLQGTVVSATQGGVFVNFDNSARLFTSASGPFTLAINDVSIAGANTTQVVSGQIQAAVPEASTWAMMLIGFGAVGFSMRRKRRSDSLLQLA